MFAYSVYFLMGVFFVCCEGEGDYSWNWEEENKTESARGFILFIIFCFILRRFLWFVMNQHKVTNTMFMFT